VAAPGVTLGTAVAFLQDLAERELPPGHSVDYGGLSRQYVQESGGFLLTFGFALVIIYLSLAALFESFRGYVDFFMLNDLVTEDCSAVKFFIPFEDFSTSSVPRDRDAYEDYRRLSIAFVEARNRRILRSLTCEQNT
jgi:hypothetical protein